MISDFNKIVITIAIIVLLIALIVLGIFLSKAMFESAYPPVISDCPDYWDVSYNSNNDIVCKAVLRTNTGKSGCDEYSPSLFLNAGSGKNDIICEKQKWAKKCGITWDGVTNNNKACELSNIG